MSVGRGFFCLAQDTAGGSCQHANERLGSIDWRKFLVKLCDSYFWRSTLFLAARFSSLPYLLHALPPILIINTIWRIVKITNRLVIPLTPPFLKYSLALPSKKPAICILKNEVFRPHKKDRMVIYIYIHTYIYICVCVCVCVCVFIYWALHFWLAKDYFNKNCWTHINCIIVKIRYKQTIPFILLIIFINAILMCTYCPTGKLWGYFLGTSPFFVLVYTV